MNILIIPSWYPSESNQQLGAFFREQALALSSIGYNIIVMDGTIKDRNSWKDKKNFKYINYIDEGINYYSHTICLYGLSRIKCLQYLILKINFIYLFNKIIKKNKIDLIHAHCILPAGYCSLNLAKNNNIPLVVTEHSSGILKHMYGKFEEKKIKKTIEECNQVISVSESLKDSIESIKYVKGKVKVINNIVDNQFKYCIPKDTKNYIFFSAGNLVESKNFELLIKSFANKFINKTNVKLRIAGMGPKYAELIKLVNDLKINNQIEFLGKISRKSMFDEYKNCNTFILISKYETFGLVYAEALACGRPVIGYRNGGANEIINSSNGILLDSLDIEQVGISMEYMIKNITNFNHKNISEEAIKKYRDNILFEISKIYDETLKGKYE